MADADGRILALYLPQFHPIPENDEWWGVGFTEWSNVVRARPQFPGHHQPHLPAGLGFYDLRLPEAREQQANLATGAGIGGFVYYHYWFGGRRLLNRPFDDVLASGTPEIPFALCWANEHWTRVWDGGANDVLVAQSHSDEDDRAHLRWLCEAFDDPRYLRVDGKPLFFVYRASKLPDPRRTTETWREEAVRLGVGDLFLVRVESFPEERTDPRTLGFDAALDWVPDWADLGPRLRQSPMDRITRKLGLSPPGYGLHRVHDYRDVIGRSLLRRREEWEQFPCVTPSWDNSARRANNGVILRGATPDLFEDWLVAALERAGKELPPGHRLVFVNAWNEWAEGNHLEPDDRWGTAWLDAVRAARLRA
jgi:lipopolysaccharide biosynthesis protein